MVSYEYKGVSNAWEMRLNFHILIIWEGTGFMKNQTFEIIIKSRRFNTPWVKKMVSKMLHVCPRRRRRICNHDNFRKNNRIGLRFGILLEDPRRKGEFVNHPFLTNGSSFIHQKHFYGNQKLNFPAKIYEIRKKC